MMFLSNSKRFVFLRTPCIYFVIFPKQTINIMYLLYGPLQRKTYSLSIPAPRKARSLISLWEEVTMMMMW